MQLVKNAEPALQLLPGGVAFGPDGIVERREEDFVDFSIEGVFPSDINVELQFRKIVANFDIGVADGFPVNGNGQVLLHKNDKVVVPGTIENFGASVEGRVGGCGFKATIDSCADGGGVL